MHICLDELARSDYFTDLPGLVVNVGSTCIGNNFKELFGRIVVDTK